ncbi:MAG: DUF1853 family protein [Myxococcota bacterium]|nr:DUF1853 family protein [Myxococcota bacterium]
MLSELNNPRVRDLAWCLQSPSLLDHQALPDRVAAPARCQWLLDALKPHLYALDQDPTELVDFLLRNPTRRVGRYFEQLIEYALTHAECPLLATNQQLHHGKRVIGELDYVFEHQTQLIHWETALKFYLEHTDGQTLTDFVGPNAADNLGLKLDRILNHQLPMGQHPAALTISGLQKRTMHSRAYVRGYLFYREPAVYAPAYPPPISPQHLRGWWRHAGEPIPQSAPDGRWYRLEKPYWLAPAQLAHASVDETLTLPALDSTIQGHFARDAHPLLLAELQRQGDTWHEVSRGFIVAPTWPARDDKSLRN